MEQKTVPQHSPLPVVIEYAYAGNKKVSATLYAGNFGGSIARIENKGLEGGRLNNVTFEGNARLITAAVNAIGELAQHLNCNPAELAERLQGGGLVELVKALTRVERGLTDLGASGEPLKSIRKALAKLKNNI